MDVAGFDEWLRFRSLPSGSRFFVRVVPGKEGGGERACDAWVFDSEGDPVEVFRRVRFAAAEDTSFASASLPDSALLLFQRYCASLCLLELDAVAPFAWKAFAGEEITPFRSMGAPRKKSYAAARIACKLLTRKLGGDYTTPADGIITVSNDRRAPQCPVAGPGASYHCAVSHDDRFCVAVAGRSRIGVDVERISGRVLRVRRRFMSDEEKSLASDFPLGEAEGSVRVWTVKEAAAKALAVSLPEAWRRVVVTAIGPAESLVRVGDLHVVARHETLEGHVFSLLELPESFRE
jgi:phosphopantetheinyl transferase